MPSMILMGTENKPADDILEKYVLKTGYIFVMVGISEFCLRDFVG